MQTVEKLTAAETKLAAAQTALKATPATMQIERVLRLDAVSTAEQNIADLRQQLDAEMEAQAARDLAEQTARKQLDATAKKLEASRASLAAAVEQARAALESVYQKAEAHAALINRTRSELTGLGLKGQTRPDGQPQTTRAVHDAVVIDGHLWIRFEPAAVLAHAVRRGVMSNRALSDRLRGLDGAYAAAIARSLSSGD